MNHLRTQEVLHNLDLADGSRWEIAAGDGEAAYIVTQLGRVMQLLTAAGGIEPHHRGVVRRLLVSVDAHKSEANPLFCYSPLPSVDDSFVVCDLRSFIHSEGLYIQLMQLSLVIAREAQSRGAVLIHGALAEWDGIGVILAAPSGTGKTTASGRLPAPWRSLCDDTTLVVRDSQGDFWAHPWPTWSRFVSGGPGGTWDVRGAVPVKGVLFLSQAIEDRVERVGAGHAISLLVECVKQASASMPMGRFKEEIRVLNVERFNNLCALSRVVPIHILRLSLTGAFWQEIEQMLEKSHCKET